jgi:hypothetical protein
MPKEMPRGVSATSMSLSGEALYLEMRFVLVSSNSIKALAHFTGSSCPSCPIWCQRVQMLSDRERCGCAWTRGSFWLNPTYFLLGIPLRERGRSHAIDERIGSKHPFPLVNDFCNLHTCVCVRIRPQSCSSMQNLITRFLLIARQIRLNTKPFYDRGRRHSNPMLSHSS